MNYWSIFAISFTVALSGALMPGPLLSAVIYESTRHGSKTGPLFILGHAILEVLMVAFIILGFSRWVNNIIVLNIITFAGAGILLYFGFSMLRSLPGLTLTMTAPPGRPGNLVWLGVTTSLANPYWTIWWLSIGLGLVLAARKSGLIAVVIFFAGHILADLGWYSLVSLMIGKGRKYLSDGIYRAVVFICAAVLIGFAFWFIIFRNTIVAI